MGYGVLRCYPVALQVYLSMLHSYYFYHSTYIPTPKLPTISFSFLSSILNDYFIEYLSDP